MQLHIIGFQVTVQYPDRAVKFKCNISLSWLGTCSNKGWGYFLLNLADFLPKGCCLTAIFVKYTKGYLEKLFSLRSGISTSGNDNTTQNTQLPKWILSLITFLLLTQLLNGVLSLAYPNFLAITDRKTDTHYGI